jgi:hypothetical protein
VQSYDSDMRNGQCDRRSGLAWTGLRSRGHAVFLALSLHVDEVDRRCRVAADPLLDRTQLHAVWSLPPGGPVSLEALSPGHRDLVESLPPGWVECRRGLVRRLASPPVTIECAIVASSSARSAMVCLGEEWWARVQIVQSERPASSQTRISARRWGIGLIEGDRCTVRPRDQRLGTPNVNLWHQAEKAYAALIDSER